nr:hypothetical protein [Luteococcus japonicus]
MSMCTRPTGHADEYPFVSVDVTRLAPMLGCAVHSVAVDATPESYVDHARGVQDQECIAARLNDAEVTCLPLNAAASKFRNDRATCPEPLLPNFNSPDVD